MSFSWFFKYFFTKIPIYAGFLSRELPRFCPGIACPKTHTLDQSYRYRLWLIRFSLGVKIHRGRYVQRECSRQIVFFGRSTHPSWIRHCASNVIKSIFDIHLYIAKTLYYLLVLYNSDHCRSKPPRWCRLSARESSTENDIHTEIMSVFFSDLCRTTLTIYLLLGLNQTKFGFYLFKKTHKIATFCRNSREYVEFERI